MNLGFLKNYLLRRVETLQLFTMHTATPKTGIIYDPQTTLHKCARKHPERPERVINTIQQLKDHNFLNHPHVEYIQKIPPIKKQLIETCHSQSYVNHVENLWTPGLRKKQVQVLDTYFNEHSKHAAELAAGGVIVSIDKIMSSIWNNAFAVVRPPGHHSGVRSVINGFCIYNNVAIGAKYLRSQYGLKKILIFDWDVHHGDGTQHIFREDQNILFISLHRYDHGTFYPGESGDFKNAGSGKAEGFQINIPWNTTDQNYRPYQQNPGDNEYIYVYERLLAPIIKEFNPEFIFISAGFDSARGDPIGGLRVSPDCYHYLTTKLMSICDKILVVLEGGYNIVSVANSVEGVVQALLKQDISKPENKLSLDQKKYGCWLPSYYHKNLDEVKQNISKYWKVIEGQKLIKYEQKIKGNNKRLYGIYFHDSSSESSDEQQKSSREPVQVFHLKQEQTFQSQAKSIKPQSLQVKKQTQISLGSKQQDEKQKK